MSKEIALAKGAIVIKSVPGKPKTTEYIFFQFNPNNLTRSIQPRTVGGESGGHLERARFVGAPIEAFSLVLEIEAFEQPVLTSSNQNAGAEGIYPALYALETLLYPDVADVQKKSERTGARAKGDVALRGAGDIACLGAQSRRAHQDYISGYH